MARVHRPSRALPGAGTASDVSAQSTRWWGREGTEIRGPAPRVPPYASPTRKEECQGITRRSTATTSMYSPMPMEQAKTIAAQERSRLRNAA